ncbi:hypothetical protein HD597_005085 [Nonomuraea thailandensis]|uniref:Uncharacterized protein n=1 Tax=Nonomuraea thailandensis TaxID=1188745 RepID=A0A9X2GHT7_9ACTN|nr:hypothetical protein [Nonomuraea thailandensis]MCP2358065.1 hypothetical protein [Nonomuraea thailandensis]
MIARHQCPEVNAKVAGDHGRIPRQGLRAVAATVGETAATRDREVR